MFFGLNSGLLSQVILKKQLLFEDFKYSSVQFPTEGDSSGSIFGKNPWVTNDGIVYSRAWHRYNRDEHQFSPQCSIVPTDFGFTLNMNKGFKSDGVLPMICSGFLFDEGTYVARIKVYRLHEEDKMIYAFWLTSPLYFIFERAGETLRFWEEMDFEFNNWFNGVSNLRVQCGCCNRDGQNIITRPLDCIVKNKSGFAEYENCDGLLEDREVFDGRWLLCMFNVDKLNNCLKFSILSDDSANYDISIWSGENYEPETWNIPYVIENYFPNYKLSTVFSLHGNNNKNDYSFDVDWLYYSPNPKMKFSEVYSDVNELRRQKLSRVNTTGQPIFYQTTNDEPFNIYIQGPKTVYTCQPNKWKLESNYHFWSQWEVDFKYRYYTDGVPDEWLGVYSPEITLTARQQHTAIEFQSVCFDYWENYYDTSNVMVKVEQIPCQLNENEVLSFHLLKPNPANYSIEVEFELFRKNNVSVKIYNSLGVEVGNILNGTFERGVKNIPVDLSRCADGIYFCMLNCGGKVFSQTFAILRNHY